MSEVKVAVFASGSGSNFQAMLDAALPCRIELLVCDKPGAKVVERAKKMDVPVWEFSPQAFPSKEAYEQAIVEQLQERKVEWIFLAGYMRLVGPVLLGAYANRMINIHPSLLPKFPGLDAIGQAFRAGERETGVTVHYIDEGMDTGPIIAQESVDIYPNDTMETLETRIHQVEHMLYPQVIRKLIK